MKLITFLFIFFIDTGGTRLLVVLHFEIHRILWHILLCDAQTLWSSVDAARHPSRHYALFRLVGRKIHTRRSLVVLRFPQHLRAYIHVHLLHVGGDGSQSTKVFVVEEISHCLADDSIRFGNGALIPIILPQRLQLSNWFCILHWRTCGYVLFPLLGLLQTGLSQAGAEGEWWLKKEINEIKRIQNTLQYYNL